MEQDYLEKIIENGYAMRDMMKSPGWKILSEWLIRQIDSRIQSLITCDLSQVKENRAEIRAYRSVMQKCAEFIQLARQVEEKINKEE